MFKSLFRRQSKKAKTSQSSLDISSTTATFKSGQKYVQKWDKKLKSGKSLETINDFRDELFFFLTAVSNKWLDDSSLSEDELNDLNLMIEDLSEILTEASDLIRKLEIDAEIQEENESLIDAVISESPKSPNYSKWVRDSFDFSEKLIQAASDMQAPNEGGLPWAG